MPTTAEPILSRYLHNRGHALGLPIAGTFELTARCNFNCKMCYVHLSEAEQRRRGRELTAAEWISIAERAKDAGMVFLLLTGGEPTLRPDFPEIYTALKKMGFMISINSNGYLLQDKILELFANDPPVRINISLYGTSDETYRNLCGVPAYHRILTNIENLRRAGVEVKINMSLTPDNMRDMEALYQQAVDLDVNVQSTPYMFPPIRHSMDMVGKNCRMSAEDAGKFMAKYKTISMTEDEFCRFAAAIEKGIATSPDGDACEGTPGQGIKCRGGSTSFWLTWDGKMMPCGQMVEPAHDVLQMGFDAAWKATIADSAKIRIPDACATCEMNKICHSCAAMCYCETGHFDGKPEYVCQMYRSFVDHTLRYWHDVYGGKTPKPTEKGNKNED